MQTRCAVVSSLISGRACGAMINLAITPSGFYKVFDEILVNAIDNHARDRSTSRIDINLPSAGETEPLISITNNGRGIPVEYHDKENMYVPELIFGMGQP